MNILKLVLLGFALLLKLFPPLVDDLIILVSKRAQ
jgi:hypothetical protein